MGAFLTADTTTGLRSRKRSFISLFLISLSSSSIDADVVFVHGLRGGPFMTWRQQEEKGVKNSGTDCWPKVCEEYAQNTALNRPYSFPVGVGIGRCRSMCRVQYWCWMLSWEIQTLAVNWADNHALV